jgi:hypothetical protein
MLPFQRRPTGHGVCLPSHSANRLEIDAERGLRVNGRPYEMKGACVHHDNGPLGVAAIDRAEERRVEILKAAGFNAIRTGHNPPSPAFLDAADRLGSLIGASHRRSCGPRARGRSSSPSRRKGSRPSV